MVRVQRCEARSLHDEVSAKSLHAVKVKSKTAGAMISEMSKAKHQKNLNIMKKGCIIAKVEFVIKFTASI